VHRKNKTPLPILIEAFWKLCGDLCVEGKVGRWEEEGEGEGGEGIGRRW